MPQTLDLGDPLVRLFSDFRSMSDRHKAVLDPYLDTDGYVDDDSRRNHSRRDRAAAVEARELLERAMAMLEGRFALPDGMPVTVPGADHSAHALITGRLDAAARDAFRHGQCHAFARALCEHTGWAMAVIISPECSTDADQCSMGNVARDVCGCQLEHVVVVRPDGAHVDITGAHLPGTLPDYEDQEAVAMTDAIWSHICRSPLWRRPAVDVARTFVAPLLASLGEPRAAA